MHVMALIWIQLVIRIEDDTFTFLVYDQTIVKDFCYLSNNNSYSVACSRGPKTL